MFDGLESMERGTHSLQGNEDSCGAYALLSVFLRLFAGAEELSRLSQLLRSPCDSRPGSKHVHWIKLI